jgi:hypothetical protein
LFSDDELVWSFLASFLFEYFFIWISEGKDLFEVLGWWTLWSSSSEDELVKVWVFINDCSWSGIDKSSKEKLSWLKLNGWFEDFKVLSERTISSWKEVS